MYKRSDAKINLRRGLFFIGCLFISLFLVSAIRVAISSAEEATLRNEDVHVISQIKNPYAISWAYSTSATNITWEKLTEGTPYEGYLVSKYSSPYVMGCVPAAIGQTMLYLLRYRYPDYEKYGMITTDDYQRLLVSRQILVDFKGSDGQESTANLRKHIRNANYHWDKMPGLTESGQEENVEKYITPLVIDLGTYLRLHYQKRPVTVSTTGVRHWKRVTNGDYVVASLWDGAETMRAFGFYHARQMGYGASILDIAKTYGRGFLERLINEDVVAPSRNALKYFETNLDHGHPVVVADKSHANMIVGYGVDKNSLHKNRSNKRLLRSLPRHFNLNGGYGSTEPEPNWLPPHEMALLVPTIIYNIFPKRPDEISSFPSLVNAHPAILSGMVIAHSDRDKKYVRIESGGGASKWVLESEVNLETGIYSSVIPSDLFPHQLTLTVLDENKKPHPDYSILKRTTPMLKGSLAMENIYAADFFPPSTATSVTGLDTPPPALTAQGRTAKILTRDDLLRIFTPQEPSAPVSNDLDRYAYRTVVVASDPELDATGQNAGQYIEDVVKAKAFVAAGGTLVATGRSSIFPAFMGGSAGPKFYQFSYLLQPYGGSKQTETTVVPREIIERMGGVRTFQMNSSLPRSQHSIIKTAGNAKIISTTSHLMQEYDSMWGTWNYNMYPVPNVIEYPIGDKGGKVIYISGELSENYGESTVNRMFVDAMLDSALRGDDDEYDVADALGGDYFSDPTRRPNAMNQTNLNMVVYQNGITVANKKIGTDQSFVFNISERLAPSVAPQIDSSGAPELMVSLYDPSGALVSTRTAIPGESSIAFAVQATRNNIAGDWKCVVEDVHGFDGERVVVLAVVDGKHEINLEELEEVASQFEEIDEDVPDVVGSARMIKQSKRVASVRSMQNGEKLYPRGIQSGVLYRQLGDGRIEVGSRSFTSAQKIRSASNSVLAEQISKVSFGPLVVSSDVKIWREDDDLVIEVAGVNDRVNLAEWFINGSVKEVSFVDGSMSAVDMREKAVAREPEIYFIPALTDTTIRGTDESDRLTGNGKNALLLGGKGDDFISTNGGTSVFYYRRGDGHDTIFARKNTAKDMSVLRFDKDILSSDVKVDRSNNDMIFTIGDGSITVKDSFFGEATQLDRVEFFNGEVWDVRDVAKRAAGKPILPRRVYMELPNTEKQKEANDDLSASAETKQSSSGCNALGGVWPLLLSAVLAVIFKKRQNQGVSPDSILK